MKKLFQLFFVFVIVTMVSSCDNNTQVKHYFCDSFVAECELEKDYQFVKVLSADPAFVDAYGNQLKVDTWYLRSTKSGQFIVANTNESISNYSWNDFEFADDNKGNSLMQVKGMVSSDTVEIRSTASWTAKVKILIFGPREIRIYEAGRGIAYQLSK
jgi:hypothetical protein